MSEMQPAHEYALPEGYEDTRAVLMARDPHWLYLYWNIAEGTAKSFYDELGGELWDKSTPVIKVTNVSLNKRHYIRINDFSTSWYINVPDARCMYTAEIGRKISDGIFISFAASNFVETPGDNMGSPAAPLFVDFREAAKSCGELLQCGPEPFAYGRMPETASSLGFQVIDPDGLPSSSEAAGRFQSDARQAKAKPEKG